MQYVYGGVQPSPPTTTAPAQATEAATASRCANGDHRREGSRLLDQPQQPLHERLWIQGRAVAHQRRKYGPIQLPVLLPLREDQYCIGTAQR